MDIDKKTDKKMKVLMIEIGGWGGIAHYTYNLCQALADKEAEVVLFTNAEYELDEFPRNFSLKKIINNSWPYFKKVRALVKAVNSEKADIVHFQSIFTARRDWVWFLLLRLFGAAAVVFTAHNVLPHEEEEAKTKGVAFSLGQIYRSSNAIVVHTKESKVNLINKFGIKKDKVNVIAHGNYVFLSEINTVSKQQARRQLGIEQNTKIVLAFGTIRKYKGLDYLIPAFKQALEKAGNAKLVIAGLPIRASIQYYEGLINKNGLGENVIFKPEYIPLSDLSIYLRAADAAVFAYTDIDESGALQLALAFSKPVVVTNVGAFYQAVDEGKNGYIVRPRDTRDLASGIIKVLLRNDLDVMGEYSLKLAQERYSWQDIAGKTIDMYNGIY